MKFVLLTELPTIIEIWFAWHLSPIFTFLKTNFRIFQTDFSKQRTVLNMKSFLQADRHKKSPCWLPLKCNRSIMLKQSNDGNSIKHWLEITSKNKLTIIINSIDMKLMSRLFCKSISKCHTYLSILTTFTMANNNWNLIWMAF